jgi:hypothetical protein
MANEPNDTVPAAAENRATAPAATAPSATAAKPAKASETPAPKARARSAPKRSKAPAGRRSASATRSPRNASPAPASPAAARADRRGLGVTVADLVESNARSYVSAQEQIASGTWIAPIAELNARVITQVAATQADLARRLLG